MQSWPLLDHSSCVLALKESFQKVLPQRFWFHLTTTHFSAPDDKQQFSQQGKGFTLVVLGLLEVTADSSFQADQALRESLLPSEAVQARPPLPAPLSVLFSKFPRNSPLGSQHSVDFLI